MRGSITSHWGHRDKLVYHGGQRLIYGVLHVVNLRWYGASLDINVDKTLDPRMH